MTDPDWHPWVRSDAGDHVFPSIGQVGDSVATEYRRSETFHELYDVIRWSKAIVSKPGGSTLIDSLSSATPVVLLEPYGYAEQSNARIWEHLGFGIAYSDWQRTGYDPAVLENLHTNLSTRSPRGTNYPRAYADRLRATAT
jgi:UDP-N-acetylglucosamine:LPS N-acetylglucosamine transferase